HTFTSQRRDANENLLAEGLLGVFRDANLLFDRAHQLLVRLHLFIGNGVAQLGFIAIGFDVVQVVVQQGTSRLLVGVNEGALYLFSCHVIVFFTRFADEVQVVLALFTCDAGMLIESIAQRTQRINGIDAGGILLDQRIGEAIDNIARRDTIHALAYRFFL